MMGYARGYTDGMATPGRHIRINDALYKAVQRKAEAEGRDVSAVIRELLIRWVQRPPKMQTKSPFE